VDENIGIYCYENKVNGKKYIGKSKDLTHRIKNHERNFKKDFFEETRAENKPLWNAVKKYGRENFLFSILEKCSFSKLDKKEIYWIKELKSHVSENGYNIQFGGNQTNKNIKLTENHKNKIGNSVRGDKNGFFGKKHSEESKKIISDANKGKKLSKRHIEIIKEVNSKPKSELTKQKMADAARGKKSSNSSSLYFGVSKKGNSWQVTIKIRGKQIYIGISENEIEAAKMYDEYVTSNNLPYSLNFK